MSTSDFSRAQLLELCSVAAGLEARVCSAPAGLAGKIVLTMFFESSTRTRLSFESAALRLGGSVISVADGDSTSLRKGESLADIGAMLDSYADVVVLRHSAERSVDEIRSGGLTVPLINGGNGCAEHPTQAMADWYALLKWRPELGAPEPPPDRRIRLGVLGTPRLMRSVRSFLSVAATCLPKAVRELTVITGDADPLDAELATAVARVGWPCRCTSDFAEFAPGFDVIYQNALVPTEHGYELAGPKVRLDSETPLKPDAVILHPLARHDELSTSLDRTRHNLYFDQAAGAGFVRQALLLAVTNRLDRLTTGRGR